MRWRAFVFFLIVLGCNRPAGVTQGPETVLNDLYAEDLAAFHEKLIQYSSEIGQETDPAVNFPDLRVAFKSIEFLLEYSDKDRHKLFNGAPVAAEDHVTPGYFIVKPSGLQVIEDYLCSGADNPEQFIQLMADLTYQTHLYMKYVSHQQFSSEQFVSAIQLHLTRMETLSLAGFDNQCMHNSVRELAHSVDVLSKYFLVITGNNEHMLVRQLYQLKELFLAKGSMHDIDLIALIKDHIQPLRESIIKLGVEEEMIPQAVNRTVASIYDPQFINASFYGLSGITVKPGDPKIALGRKLFLDPGLSATGTISCASCHDPQMYFADALKVSASDVPGTDQARNTPTLIHAAYQSRYMYDGRAGSLEDQMLHVFRNRLEFSSHITEVIDRLNEDELYYAAFTALYPKMGDKPVNLHSVTNAIASYMQSLTGHNSPFDQFMRGETEQLPEGVVNGFNLFMKKAQCGTCHFPPTFSGLIPPFFTETEMENIGVPAVDESGNWKVDDDLGRWIFFNHEALRHFFKTPTIRNSGMTAPYMHNGIHSTLQEVLAFYNHGGGTGMGLNYPNQSLSPDSLLLSGKEQEDIILFLESLTDASYQVYR
ncbi:MAG: hypothetical protein GY751_18960 [Bacteroidetes bacterium]|nr:hypothetical protein [Bacteroidota bacterium]